MFPGGFSFYGGGRGSLYLPNTSIDSDVYSYVPYTAGPLHDLPGGAGNDNYLGLSFWYKLDALPDETLFAQACMAQWKNGVAPPETSIRKWYLSFRFEASEQRIWMVQSDNDVDNSIWYWNIDNYIAANRWIHVAISWITTAPSNSRLYMTDVTGSVVNNLMGPTLRAGDGNDHAFSTGSLPFRIGGLFTDPAVTNNHYSINGKMAEIAIFDNFILENEVNNFWKKQITEDTQIANLVFLVSNGIEDISGNGNNLISSGSILHPDHPFDSL